MYCVACYRVIATRYVRSVGYVFAYLYTLDADSECPMDYETTLLPKVFLVSLFIICPHTCDISLNTHCYINKQKLIHEDALDFYDYLWERKYKLQ